MNEPDSVVFGRVLADPMRQQIMRFCCCHWRSVGEVVTEVKLSQPTVSHHLVVLRKAGLVKTRRAGKQVFYTLDQPKMASCCGQLLVAFAPEQEATRMVRKCCA